MTASTNAAPVRRPSISRRTVILLAALVVCATALIAPVTSASAAGSYPVTTQDATITSHTGGTDPDVSLDAKVYLPGGGTVHPLVVFPAAWGQKKTQYDAVAQALAGQGYVCIAYTPRGFYSSTGAITLVGPLDQADLRNVVTWGLTTYPALVTASKIGVFGVSYGAGMALNAAKGDPRVKAVVALSAPLDLANDFAPGRTAATQVLDALRSQAADFGTLSQPVDDAFSATSDDISDITTLDDTRTALKAIPQINANGAAIMIGNAWQDSLFPGSQFFPNPYPTNGTVGNWDQLTVPKKLMLAPGDHTLLETPGLLGAPNEYVDAGKAWLDHFLLGVNNGADTQGPVLLKQTLAGNTWIPFTSLAALTGFTQRRYLGSPAASTSMLPAQPAAWSASYTGDSWSGATAGRIFISGAAYASSLPPSIKLSDINPAGSVTWKTAGLSSSITLGGVSKVHVRVTPATTKVTLIAYLYDVDLLGKATLLAWKPWTRTTGVSPGIAQDADIALEPVFQSIGAGHKLAVVVDSVEERYSSVTGHEQVTLGGTSTDPAYVDVAQR